MNPKRRFMTLLAVAVLLFGLSPLFPLSPTATTTASPIVAGEYLHQVADEAEASALALEFGLVVHSVSSHGIAVFFAADGTDTERLFAAGFEPQSVSQITAPAWQTDEDPYLDQQYALTMTNTIAAWNITVGSATILIAIIDTGIDTTHVEFTGRIAADSYNPVTGETGLAAVEDDNGHGTMVAGVIAANKDNRVGIAGITQNTQLLVIKANTTNEGSFSESDIIEGIYYAVDHGADVINLSLGSTYRNSLTEAAVAYAVAAGVPVVAAAGNDGVTTPMYPASFEDVIAVSALDKDRTIADYSNFGTMIDVTAPGSDIITTTREDGYATVSGTSFAAPQVTGIIALYRSLDPDVSLAELRTRLEQSAFDLGVTGYDEYYGHGLVDALALLTDVFYEVDFETFGGSDIDSIWVATGKLLSVFTVPVLPDSVFVGWYLDAALTTPWNYVVPITADLTLYAKYTSAFHTVSFVTPGTAVTPLIVAHGESFALPATTLSGYRFIGWYEDAAFTIPYDGGAVLGDLTLHARFEAIRYYDVTYVVLGETDRIETVEENHLPMPATITREGYAFNGWYLDEAATVPYVETPVASDLVLYAGMERITFMITFVTSGTSLDPLGVYYGDTPALPDAEKSGEVFAGWFLDADYVTPYQNEPQLADLILYARFLPQTFKITLMFQDEIFSTLYFSPETVPILPEPTFPGLHFLGWFYDASLIASYEPVAITGDLVLYAGHEAIGYIVRFFTDDGLGILWETVALYGESVEPPTAPVKASTDAFDYVFLGWSETTDWIESDLDILPLFQASFRPGCVSLLPGVDTVRIGETWVNPGVVYPSAELALVVIGSVATVATGRTTIEYRFVHEDVVVYRLVRIVNVLPARKTVEITLNAGIATIPVGSVFTDPGASASKGVIVVEGAVDTDVAGIYQIVYVVDYEGITYHKTRYVFVVAVEEPLILALALSYRKEDEIHA